VTEHNYTKLISVETTGALTRSNPQPLTKVSLIDSLTGIR